MEQQLENFKQAARTMAAALSQPVFVRLSDEELDRIAARIAASIVVQRSSWAVVGEKIFVAVLAFLANLFGGRAVEEWKSGKES